MLKFTMREAKKFFFDRKRVMDAMDRATARVFGRFGGTVRLAAQRSMKQASGPKDYAAPGRPPKVHKGFLRGFIYYIYDPGERAVVIGPTPLPGRRRSPFSNYTVPEVHEKGAPAAYRIGAQKDTYTRYGRVKYRAAGRTYHYPARPYMAPAFEKVLTKLPDYWRNSIR